MCALQLWEAFSELRDSGKWNMAHIPRLHREHEARLAEGQPHELPALDIPAMPACVSAEMPRAEVISFKHLMSGASCGHA